MSTTPPPLPLWFGGYSDDLVCWSDGWSHGGDERPAELGTLVIGLPDGTEIVLRPEFVDDWQWFMIEGPTGTTLTYRVDGADNA